MTTTRCVMYERLLGLFQSDDDTAFEYADELLGTVQSLRSAGVTRRGISELLNIDERQVRQLLEYPQD